MLTVLARSGSGQLLPRERTELPNLLRVRRGLVWVDLEAPTADEVSVLSDIFHFHPLTIEDCLNRHIDPPKVDDYGGYLFVIVQALDFWAPSESIAVTELDLYVGPNYLVSFHQRPLSAVSHVMDGVAKGAPTPGRGADWLTHALLDALVDQLLPVVEAIDEEISALEDEALGRPTQRVVQRMTTLKRNVLRLRRLVAPQRDVVNRLSRGDYARLVRPETSMHFRDVYDHLVRVESMVEGLRDLGDSVISSYLSTINNRMNEIMKALSIVGTIFLPLTLVASVFGTNFAPTYEDWGWPGFLAMSASMLVTIAALLWWFRRRRWL